MKVLFVCLGNICRSPLAEGLFNHKAAKKGLSGRLSADSCGTSNYHIGDPPDPRTVRSASLHGITLHHLGRQIMPADLENYDMIIPMDKNNRATILQLDDAAMFAEKIFMMRDFDPEGKGRDVPDPYSGRENDFQEVYDILDRSTEGLINYLGKSI